MNIKIEQSALEWLKKDMGLSEGDSVRFLVRYEEDEANSPLQPGYSLRLSFEEFGETGVSLLVEGICFFVDESDLWYFDDHDLIVTYNEQRDDIEFHYYKS